MPYTNPSSLKSPRWPSAVILTVAMAVAGLVQAWPHRAPDLSETVTEPVTANDWTARAAAAARTGNTAEVIRDCRAALLLDPRHAEASLRLTDALLEQGEAAPLLDWMDDRVLEDARLAEQLFTRPGFRPWLRQDAFRQLRDEAVAQARD